jgi:hypothetical protein
MRANSELRKLEVVKSSAELLGGHLRSLLRMYL